MTHALKISDAFSSKRLFAPYFGGPSWATWRATLKAAFAEPLSVAELASFKAVAERDPPKSRVRTLACIVGRGGGKDSAASLLAAFVAITFDPRGRLRPGEKAIVMCLACDREQAGIAFRYIAGLFEQVPTLAAMVTRVTSDSVELANGTTVEVHTNSYRATRGRSIICAIFDECAFFRSDDFDFASPDTELAAAVTPGLARMPGSMLVLISTAHKRSGLLYERWKNYYGKDDDDTLVVRGSTLQFNPQFDASLIAKAVADDPQLYNAEYNSQWRDDLATFIARDLLEAAVDSGVTARPPQSGIRYKSFCDPSGGAGDSFTAAITHVEGNDTVVLDALVEAKAPFNPDTVTSQICSVLKSYRISSSVSDRYAAEWVRSAFARNDIKLEHSKRDRSAIYCDALPLFTSGRARLLDNPRLVSQFTQLERRTFPTGKDRIDHGRHGHDDLCNAAAGALVLAAERSSFDSSYAWVGGPGIDPEPSGPSLWQHPSLAPRGPRISGSRHS
jgi:hypothetical protein